MRIIERIRSSSTTSRRSLSISATLASRRLAFFLMPRRCAGSASRYGGGQCSSGHLIQQRLEQVVVLSVDHGDRNRRISQASSGRSIRQTRRPGSEHAGRLCGLSVVVTFVSSSMVSARGMADIVHPSLRTEEGCGDKAVSDCTRAPGERSAAARRTRSGAPPSYRDIRRSWMIRIMPERRQCRRAVKRPSTAQRRIESSVAVAIGAAISGGSSGTRSSSRNSVGVNSSSRSWSGRI